MRSIWHGWQSSNQDRSPSPLNFNAHMISLFIIKVKMRMFIIWSCNPLPQLCWLLSLETYLEHIVQSHGHGPWLVCEVVAPSVGDLPWDRYGLGRNVHPKRICVNLVTWSRFGTFELNQLKNPPLHNFYRFSQDWPVANLSPLIWTGQYPIYFF